MRNRKMLSVFVTAVGLMLQAAAAPAQEAENAVLFTNVNVWDGTSDGLQNGMSVLVEGNKISQVAASISAPSGATVIEGSGRTLMPGLIDMHTHVMFPLGLPLHETLWDAEASGAMAKQTLDLYLQMGYTTLRDMCGSASLSRAVATGVLEGPRFYSSGGCLGTTGSHTDWGNQTDWLDRESNHMRSGNSWVVNSPDEMRAAARWNFRNGATFLKVMVGGGVASAFDPLESITISKAELETAVQVAENFGSFVCIHVYHSEHINLAIDAGVRCIEHGFLMDEATMKRMADEGIVLSAQSFMSYTSFQDPSGIQGFGPEQVRKGLQVNKGADAMFNYARDAGVEMFAGSDMFTPGLMRIATQNITQLERWFTPVQALRMATSGAGKWLMATGYKNPYKDHQLGVIEEGAYADLILVNGDPTVGTDVLADYDANIHFVMKDGKIFKNTLGE
jgi:imidazolonepropionase-like amidohydrolase